MSNQKSEDTVAKVMCVIGATVGGFVIGGILFFINTFSNFWGGGRHGLYLEDIQSLFFSASEITILWYFSIFLFLGCSAGLIRLMLK